MGLNKFTIDFQNIGKEKSFRCDVDFSDFQNNFTIDKYYSFNDLFQFQKDNKVNVESLEDDFFYSEISNVSKEGEVEPVKLNFSERREEEENYYKKIEKGDIIKVSKNDILLSKVRPNLKKYVLVNSENEKYFYTSAFIHLKPKILGKILYYSLRTVFYHNLIAISRQGKGYPTLKEDDFLSLKFDKAIIDNLLKNQDQIAIQIELIEKRINKLKTQVIHSQEIINNVFAKEFGFEIDEVNKIERVKYFSTSNDITYRNINLRTSVRWNKIKPIQEVLYNGNPYIEKLGQHILTTKNGWSPNCKETDTDNSVFGVDSITKDGYIIYEDLKFSNETKSNITEYYAKEGDLFVSRGNTVDLVALASVIKNIPEDQNFIFPDLFIRVEVDSKTLNKEYLAFLFNSIIGRYYFKYAAKGKNQTMVKISSEELNNFYLPIPPIKFQQKIVNEIKEGLNKQQEVKNKIEDERQKIDQVIFRNSELYQ